MRVQSGLTKHYDRVSPAHTHVHHSDPLRSLKQPILPSESTRLFVIITHAAHGGHGVESQGDKGHEGPRLEHGLLHSPGNTLDGALNGNHHVSHP